MTTRCYPSRRQFLLTTLAVPLATQAMLGAQTKKPMRIAFIGSGRLLFGARFEVQAIAVRR